MNALALTASRRLVVPAETYNDSTEAVYARSLDQRYPYMRSSNAQIVVLDEPATQVAAHEWALIAAGVIAVIALVLYG